MEERTIAELRTMFADRPDLPARTNIAAACRRGTLPAVKPGHDWLIRPTDFEVWLASPRRAAQQRRV